jgi:NADH-quinone oxidoreductase subunit K|uniref:NADH dehydrogenase subunit 4l n=1 Tax=Vannella croatica TaxID=1778588 RepID=A0A2I6SS00_9EUKA|nr:NADH dehydrogenase subunit 4l [Vannella croatica]
MFISYIYCYFISLNILLVGILGCFLIKRNLILILICIELMLISVQLNFIVSSYNFNDLLGQIFNLFILMVAAAEVAIGLALLIINYRLRGTIETKFIYLSKG